MLLTCTSVYRELVFTVLRFTVLTIDWYKIVYLIVVCIVDVT